MLPRMAVGGLTLFPGKKLMALDCMLSASCRDCPPKKGVSLRFCVDKGDGIDSRGAKNLIPAQEIAGCWACLCYPGFVGCEARSARGRDKLEHKMCCCPLLLPHLASITKCQRPDVWERQGATNRFKKVGSSREQWEFRYEIEYKRSGGCMCRWAMCEAKCCC